MPQSYGANFDASKTAENEDILIICAKKLTAYFFGCKN